MRRTMWVSAAMALLAVAPVCAARQAPQSAQNSGSKQTAAKKQGAAGSAQTESLAQAAAKARAQEKNAPKAPMVFTNDNIPRTGDGISVVGSVQAPAKASTTGAKKPASENHEKYWRQKFADARHKIAQDQQELSIMQRELGELNVQYYPNPTKAMEQSVSRSDIQAKQNAIAAKQKELEADKQALSNLEDELHRAGGDPGWARE